jgi:tRNA wybutosine-synthesizing protein 2
MRVRRIPVGDLSRVAGEDWVDPSRKPYVRGDCAFVPVRDGYSAEIELDERRRYTGRGYHMIGDIAVLHGPVPDAGELEQLVAWKRPRGVLVVEGYDGIRREPRTRLVYGEAGEVCHREAGYTFWLDPGRVMFAQGNRQEKERIARMIRESGQNERIGDMFAGIGYFTIPAACSGASVHAMEINPVAFSYLKRNITANRIADRVEAACGDCRDLLSGIYDRLIMGHFDAVEMLPDALLHVRPGSTVHLHSIGAIPDRIGAVAHDAGFDAEISVRKVKKYAPGAWHVVQDVKIG